MIKSTLRRSIRRAQVPNLIGRNVVELIDLPSGRAAGFVKVVRASKGRYGATHPATETGELACGNKPHANATVTDVSTELKDAMCRTEVRKPVRSRLALTCANAALFRSAHGLGAASPHTGRLHTQLRGT
jgi:hypothetical protein